ARSAARSADFGSGSGTGSAPAPLDAVACVPVAGATAATIATTAAQATTDRRLDELCTPASLPVVDIIARASRRR
ncbi:MAG: hypothetical protein WAS51_17510, partial [Ilumatobacteraceae bacterium]